MNSGIFWGVFAAVAVALLIVGLIVRTKLRRFCMKHFGTASVMDAMEKTQQEAENTPRSVSGYEQFLMPQILADFPDFDADLAKSYGVAYIRKQLKDKQDVQVHKIVFTRYLRTDGGRTIVMQAPTAYREQGHRVQTRYELHYSYLIKSGDASVASTCPNCGGALGYGVQVCPYCDCRVVNVLGKSWEFTRMQEN